MRKSIATACLTVLSAVLPTLAHGEEVLRIFPPAGLEGVHVSETPGLRLVEYVTEGQTLEFWSQALTVAELPGSTLDAVAFVDQVSADILRACPAAFRMDPEVVTVEERDISMSIHACQNIEPTGRSEVAVLRVLEGDSGLYAVQITWSESPPREELLRWSNWLRDVTLCDAEGCLDPTAATDPGISPDAGAPTE